MINLTSRNSGLKGFENINSCMLEIVDTFGLNSDSYLFLSFLFDILSNVLNRKKCLVNSELDFDTEKYFIKFSGLDFQLKIILKKILSRILFQKHF